MSDTGGLLERGAETRDRGRLRRQQDERLRAATAAPGPDAFRAAELASGIAPGDARTVGHLARSSFTTGADPAESPRRHTRSGASPGRLKARRHRRHA